MYYQTSMLKTLISRKNYSSTKWLPRFLNLPYSRIPSNLRLKSLSAAHVDRINSVWPHRYEGSEKFIAYSIKYHLSVGLFNEHDDLLAWSLRYDNSSLAVIQVEAEHFRKGYGSLVAKAISKQIASEDGCDVISLVVPENLKSTNMFSKLGFREAGNHTWFVMTKMN